MSSKSLIELKGPPTLLNSKAPHSNILIYWCLHPQILPTTCPKVGFHITLLFCAFSSCMVTKQIWLLKFDFILFILKKIYIYKLLSWVRPIESKKKKKTWVRPRRHLSNLNSISCKKENGYCKSYHEKKFQNLCLFMEDNKKKMIT